MNDRDVSVTVCVSVCVYEEWEGETGQPGPAERIGQGVAQHLCLRAEWKKKNSFALALRDSCKREAKRECVCSTELGVNAKESQTH